MKVRRTKITLIGLLVALTLFGCESNEVSTNKLFIKEISDPLCYKYEFDYDGPLLVSFRVRFAQRIAQVTDFQYRGDQLIRINVNTDHGMTIATELEYGTSGLIEKETAIYNFDSPEHTTQYTTTTFFEYDENDVLRSQIMTYDDPNSLPLKTEFEWSNGNLIKMSYHHLDKTGAAVHAYHRYFVYDHRRNHTNQNIAFMYINGKAETSLSKNNVIAIKNDRLGDSGELTDEVTYAFTYNMRGYPTKYTATYYHQDYSPTVQLTYE
jgi:hypothetical protein